MKGIMKAYKNFSYVKIIGVWISGISLIGMMFLITYDVFARNVLNNSINGGFEIVQNYFMPIVIFPALAFAYSSGVLPKMDLLLDKLNNNVKKVVIMGMLLLEIFILVLLTDFTWAYAMDGFARKMSFPAAGTLYPVFPLFFFIPVAFVLIIVENVFILVRNFMEKEPSFLFHFKNE
ncbi:MAG TPA: TRAP transporter small permease [Bacillales bacterium]|nr:TRAP transporter small permease [Bacillales bacterium]